VNQVHILSQCLREVKFNVFYLLLLGLSSSIFLSGILAKKEEQQIKWAQYRNKCPEFILPLILAKASFSGNDAFNSSSVLN